MMSPHGAQHPAQHKDRDDQIVEHIVAERPRDSNDAVDP